LVHATARKKVVVRCKVYLCVCLRASECRCVLELCVRGCAHVFMCFCVCMLVTRCGTFAERLRAPASECNFFGCSCCVTRMFTKSTYTAFAYVGECGWVAYLIVLVHSVENESDGSECEHGREDRDHGLLAVGAATRRRGRRSVGHNHLVLIASTRRAGRRWPHLRLLVMWLGKQSRQHHVGELGTFRSECKCLTLSAVRPAW
jgi:hypothetical protein